MPRRVSIRNQEPRLMLPLAAVRAACRALDTGPYPAAAGELSLAFVTEPTCVQLHLEFFGDPSLTDVMTFPGDPVDNHLGDIAICPSTAQRHSSRNGKDFATELSLYLVHGWLHLCGMEDATDKGRRAMRRAEKALLEHLRTTACIPAFHWRY